MSLLTKFIGMAQRALSERRKQTRKRQQHMVVPCLEILEERELLSTYWWRPNPDLQVAGQNLVSVAGNWRDGPLPDAAVKTEAPGANDKLFFRPTGNAVLDAAASDTYAAIVVNSGGSISLRQSATFTGNDGSGTPATSAIHGGLIRDPQLDDRSLTFSGSPLTLSGGSFEDTVRLINAAENVMDMSGDGGYFSFGSKLINNGTINWTEGTWEFESATINNSGTFNITAWNGAIQPGALGGGVFNNLNVGTININGAIAVTIGVETFTNAGIANFTGGSTTAFKVNEFRQTAGAINITDDSVVDVEVEDGGPNGSGMMIVNGGTVGGSGTIQGTVQVGQATVRPGTTTTAGVLNVTGNVTMGGQTQTSILITGNNTSSQLAVTGTVTLGGNLTVAIPAGANINANQSWTIITGTRQGQFAAPTTQPAGFSAPTYNAGSVAVQNPQMQVCGPQITNEDTALVFSAANNNAISFPVVPDAGLAELQIQLVAFYGTTTLASTSGLTFLTGTGSGDTEMTFTGTIDDINAALEGLTFLPSANYNGPASLDINVSDTYPSGGTYYDANSVLINVIAVNDAPSGSDKTVTALEDMPYTFSVADFGFMDGNDSPANNLLAVQITNLSSGGTLTNNGVVIPYTGATVSLDDINNGWLAFTPTPGTSGTPYATFSFQMQDDGGTANGGVDLDTTPRFMTIHVTSVNDAPRGADKTVTTLEDTPYTFTAADFGFSDANDTPADSWIFVMISSLPDGTLTDDNVVLGVGDFVSLANINAGKLRYTPPANSNQNNNACFASFTFRVQDDGGTANGGVDLDPTARRITIDVTPVNDAPTGADNIIGIGTNYTFFAVDFGFADLLDLPANYFLDLTITSLPITGTLFLNGNAVTVNQVILYADIPNLTYTTTGWQSGVAFDSFKFKVRDDGGTANGGIDTSLDEYTLTFWGTV